jgi:hypothetical protein
MNADDAHSLMLAPMIARTGNLGSIRHRKNRDYQPSPQPPICPIMPGGRAIAAVLRDRRGKSGLHETTVPDNVRRSRRRPGSGTVQQRAGHAAFGPVNSERVR